MFAIVLAMGVQALRLGDARKALIAHHDLAANDLERVADTLDGMIFFGPDRPIDPDTGRAKPPSAIDWARARAYRRLAIWYRWQAWRFRLPLFASVSRFEGLDPVEIDTREWIKKLGFLERIERKLADEESTAHVEQSRRP